MTPTEANDLAVRIHSRFPAGPITIAEWATHLQHLDAGTAGTTLQRLNPTHNRQPSLAEFDAVYRTVNTPANDPLPTTHCGCGDGLVTVWIERGGRQIRCAAPCPNCALGRARSPQIADIASRSVLNEPDPTTPRERVDHLPTDLFHQEPTP